MSSPRLPQHVYWRRRLAVLLVLAAIVAVVVLIVVRPGAGSAEPAAEETSAPPAEAAAPAAPVQEEGADCLPGSVRVEPVTNADSYGPDSLPQISMSITNTSAVACDFNGGTTQQVLRITSGADVIWTSTDCQQNPVDAVVTLEPNQPVTTGAIEWDRTRSTPDTCDSDRPVASADGASYHLEVSVGEIAGASTKQFLLS